MAKRRQQGLFEKQSEMWVDAPTVKLVVEEVTGEPERARAARKSAEPGMKKSAAKKPATKKAAPDEPVAQKPAAQKPVAQQRVADEPVVEKPTAKKAAVKKALPEKPVAGKPVAKKSVAEETLAERPATAKPATAKKAVAAKLEAELEAEVVQPAGKSRRPRKKPEAEPTAEAELEAGRAAAAEVEPMAELVAEPAAEWVDSEPVGERLQKLLARAGVASRRRAEELIAEGRVQVNGQVVTEPGTRAVMGRDHVRVDGKLIQAAERMRYFVLNKPKGYVTTVSDPEGRPTVMEFFRGVRERLYPVGRLDYLSEGLLVMTNDGELANGLTRAAHGVEKRYLVKVSGEPTEAELASLREGVVIERGRPGSGEGRVRTAPAQVQKVREGDNPWFEVVLIEGRNRELRKMFEEIGHHVEKIRRVGYGPLELDVEPGKLRELDEDELRLLKLASEGKWKPKRRREPIALPKEAGRSVQHGRGAERGRGGQQRGFAGKPGGFAGRPGGRADSDRAAGAGRTGAGRTGAGQRFEPKSGERFGQRSGDAGSAGRGQWRDRGGAEQGERGGERPARTNWRPGGAGAGSRAAAGPGDGRGGDFRREGGSARSGKFAGRSAGRPESRPTDRAGGRAGNRPGNRFGSREDRGPESRPAQRPARRWDREGTERGFERGAQRSSGPGSGRGFERGAGAADGARGDSARSGSGRTGFGKPGFAKSGFAKPGFGKSASGRPGSGRAGFGRSSDGRGAGREFGRGAEFGPGGRAGAGSRAGAGPSGGQWKAEDEKPQPGGRNSTQRMGPDGKPREKKRWRDSFEGKSKGKPKWSAKPRRK